MKSLVVMTIASFLSLVLSFQAGAAGRILSAEESNAAIEAGTAMAKANPPTNPAEAAKVRAILKRFANRDKVIVLDPNDCKAWIYQCRESSGNRITCLTGIPHYPRDNCSESGAPTPIGSMELDRDRYGNILKPFFKFSFLY
jgi:hypothetical protein